VPEQRELLMRAIGEGERIGRELGQSVRMHQLRRIYNVIAQAYELARDDTQLENAKTRLVLLRPQLAYAAGRIKELDKLCRELQRRIQNCENLDAIEELYYFTQAVVAYHRGD